MRADVGGPGGPERSHPVLEETLLARGEWWHFDGGDRERIRAGYLRIL